MSSEVLIKGRDAAFFAERLAAALPDLRFHAAHDPAEVLAKCGSRYEAAYDAVLPTVTIGTDAPCAMW